MSTHPLNVYKRAGLIVNQLRGKFGTLLGVDSHDMLEQLAEIGSVSNFLRVQKNLIKLSGFRKAGDDLVGNVGTEVHTQRQGEIVGSNNITKLFSAFKLLGIVIS